MNHHPNPWLDTCRALAILLVLLSHGRVYLRAVWPATDYLRFGGFMGVELFFVLSGFLIGGILLRLARRGGPWLRGFYARRWLRTLPSYYLFLAINILLVILAVRPGALADAWSFAVFAQNLFSPPPLFFPEAWSLAVEEVFYLLFPAAFLLVARVTGIPDHAAMPRVAVAVIVATLVARLLLAPALSAWDDEIRKVAFLRFDTLMIGVLLAWLHDHGSRWLRGPWPLAGAAGFAACSIYFAITPDAELNASFFAKSAFLTVAALACAGVVIAGIRWRLPELLRRPSAFLARVSYSAYLVNLPVAMTLVHVIDREATTAPMALAYWLAFMVATLLLSWLLHRTYERFFNEFRDRRFPA